MGVSVVGDKVAPDVGAAITESFLKLCQAAREQEGSGFDAAFGEFYDASEQ